MWGCMSETGPAVVWTRAAVQHVFTAAYRGQVEKVTAALDAGFPPSVTFGTTNVTLLHYCCYSGYHKRMHDVVLRMLASGWDPNARDDTGVTPVHEACASGTLEMVQAVVAAGGRLDSLNKFDETPLFCATGRSSTHDRNAERCRLLQWLADRPDVDWCHQNEEGETALEAAMAYGGLPCERHNAIAAAAMETQRERTARWTPLRTAFVGTVAVAVISSG